MKTIKVIWLGNNVSFVHPSLGILSEGFVSSPDEYMVLRAEAIVEFNERIN